MTVNELYLLIHEILSIDMQAVEYKQSNIRILKRLFLQGKVKLVIIK